MKVSILRIRPTKQPNEAEELEWKNTKTAASYRFNDMKRRKEWENWRRKTESYNKFSSNSKSGFLSVSSEFTFQLERIWFVLCFIRFYLSALVVIVVVENLHINSYGTTRILFLLCFVHERKKCFHNDLVEEIAILRNFFKHCSFDLHSLRLTHSLVMHSLDMFERSDAYIWIWTVAANVAW